MEGVWRKGVSKNRLYEVSASKIPSTKFCEGFWDFVAVRSPTGPPFHELSTNSLGFYECPAPSTMLVEQVFAKPFLCTTLPFASDERQACQLQRSAQNILNSRVQGSHYCKCSCCSSCLRMLMYWSTARRPLATLQFFCVRAMPF